MPPGVKVRKRKYVLQVSHKSVDFSELQGFFELIFVKEEVVIHYLFFFSKGAHGGGKK